ncbi:Fic family protein [Senegalimassilia anaerobia]|uniref:Fido domain-containing protein n=1 Tax=Senegalimassilia anaerobia TaxID=1473216 RepID=A0A369L6H6_9ACTN|nr:Fic family protein [Senegalimassilia anaerobia]RDB55020.1 hypothetical protein C1880_07250 [Senegalimassilia anaerobia]
MSDEVQGSIAELEVLAARYDCLIGESEYRTSLAHVLHRMEGVYNSLLNGIHADYRLCCYLDLFDNSHGDGNGLEGRRDLVLEAIGVDDRFLRASQCAYQICAIMDGIFTEGLDATALTPARIISLHDAIATALRSEDALGLRTWECPPETAGRFVGVAYVPPSPERLPAFLDDIAKFVVTSRLSPVLKSAFAYFQLEAVRMFSSGLDEVGRFIAACLWRNSGLIEHMMPPISITPALRAKTHDRKLKPYLFNPASCEMFMLDDWAYLVACSTRNAVELEYLCFKEACRMTEKWQASLTQAGAKMTQTLRRCLVNMIGMPVFSISSLAAEVDASFSTVARIVELFLECGIVVQATKGRRNRIFECPEALALPDWAERTFLSSED